MSTPAQTPASPSPSTAPSKSPEYEKGFAAGIKSQEARMQAQKERFREKIEQLKREVAALKGRMDVVEEGSADPGKDKRPRGQGPIRSESFADHELKIRNVERSFGI